MGFLTRWFNRNRSGNGATTADRARSQQLAGRETGQTATQQAATRGRMEAELLGQRQRREQPAAPAVSPCPHTTLVPRWDSVADMGNEEKVTTYTCQGCNQSFSAAEGRALRATEAERVRRELAP